MVDSEFISEIHERQRVQHLSAGFYSRRGKLVGDDVSLRYHQLGTDGLERLVFLLLLKDGKVPRYFGKLRPQAQYGIDLLVTHDKECSVYQAKNIKTFSSTTIKKALKKFESEWLSRKNLPRPKSFVLVCPVPHEDRKQIEQWLKLKHDFEKRNTGVSAEFWHRTYLDERLKHLPDVVADLFSDSVAEKFCELEDWNSELFRPVMPNSGEKVIQRYLLKKGAGCLYINHRISKAFAEKLEFNGKLLIRGLPGSGKTITGLALAESLHDGKYRIFYLSLRHDISEDTLFNGIKRRLSKPTIFLLDDGNDKFDLVDRVLCRFTQEIRNRCYLVFMTRTTLTPEGLLRGDDTSFIEELKQDRAILEFQPTKADFREIITLIKPQFAGLSKERLEKIFEFTARDLFFLDELLKTINSPDEVDQLNVEKLFEKTREHYFGTSTLDAPGFENLSALAQFDLAPLVANFKNKRLEEENKQAAFQLVVQADFPPRYYFLHSSAAELVFRSLAVGDYTELAAKHLIEYFKSGFIEDKRFVIDFSNVIWNRLKLARDENDEYRLKSRFLSDDTIYTFVEKYFHQFPLNLTAICLIMLKKTNAVAFERYKDLTQQKIDDGTVLDMVITRPFYEYGRFLLLAKKEYSFWLASLENQLIGRGLQSLIKKAEFQNILLFLSNSADPNNPWWILSLDSIQDVEIDNMIDRTIASGRSIGTLPLALRELKSNNPDLLKKLEHKINAKSYLRLIANAGTIVELFKVIQHSSPSMTRDLIEKLNSETMDYIVNKTIKSGHSIGTIHFALRELKNNNTDLLKKLEDKITAKRYLHLIVNAGTVAELFQVIRFSTLTMSEELIDTLDADTMDSLLTKTIASGHSIGTLSWTLRELKSNNPDLLEKLEHKITAKRYLHLIVNAGTVAELFQVIRFSTLTMSEELIDTLDADTMDSLLTKTVASGRSIGTLSWTLRELKSNNPDLLEKLEHKIGAKRYLHLIANAGTIVDLFKVIEHSSPFMAKELIETLDSETVDSLVTKTINSDRSIGTVALILRDLKKTNLALLNTLVVKIGAKRWWQLICYNGNMGSLGRILTCFDKSFRFRFVQFSENLSLKQWQELILHGNFVDLCNFVRWYSLFFSKHFTTDFLNSLKPTFETLICRDSWEVLDRGATLLQESPDSLIKKCLSDLLLDHLAIVDLSSLRFDLFDESIHCTHLLWQELPTRREELTKSLLSILPKEESWYSEEKFIRLARLLFFILARPTVKSEDALCVLAIGNSKDAASLLVKANTLDIFLYLWNLYALWFQWGRSKHQTFAAFLNTEVVDTLKDSLTKRIQVGTNQEETDNLITLVGFLSFVGIPVSPPEKDSWLSGIQSDNILLVRARTKTFIPAVFFLLGVEWIFDKKVRIPKKIWRQLLLKEKEYSEKLAALDHLREFVLSHAGLRVG